MVLKKGGFKKYLFRFLQQVLGKTDFFEDEI